MSSYSETLPIMGLLEIAPDWFLSTIRESSISNLRSQLEDTAKKIGKRRSRKGILLFFFFPAASVVIRVRVEKRKSVFIYVCITIYF